MTRFFTPASLPAGATATEMFDAVTIAFVAVLGLLTIAASV